ncbi:MAG: hypothetical protein ACOCRO_10260 [Halanaerobiales bacterium]
MGGEKMDPDKSNPNELNNNYHKKQIKSSSNSTIVKGIKWNLSNSHKEKDVCDKYATQNLYGLGPGVYPPDKVPERHDGCICYLTDVLYEGEELINRIKQKYSSNNNKPRNKEYLTKSSQSNNSSRLGCLTAIVIFLSVLIFILLI